MKILKLSLYVFLAICMPIITLAMDNSKADLLRLGGLIRSSSEAENILHRATSIDIDEDDRSVTANELQRVGYQLITTFVANKYTCITFKLYPNEMDRVVSVEEYNYGDDLVFNDIVKFAQKIKTYKELVNVD